VREGRGVGRGKREKDQIADKITSQKWEKKKDKAID
jgi:hypothetical protein